MYHLLFVDDEPLAIQGIESGIQWDKLGVADISKASNIRQAKEVFGNHQVDIMLCDIEMPQGNGLDLLEWVRENYPSTETIMLTCHTDFEYARKALKLGSLDYVLKAMTYDELETVILKAIRKIEKDKKANQLSDLWSKNQPYLLEQFWRDILNGKVPPQDESIEQAATERNIAFSAKVKIWPMLVNIIPQTGSTAEAAENRYITEFDNAVRQALGDEVIGQIVHRDKEDILCILRSDQRNRQNMKDFTDRCHELTQSFRKQYGCNMYLYIGSETKAAGLPDMVAKLFVLQKNNVALRTDILFLESNSSQFSTFSVPDMSLWSSMISENEYGLLIKDIDKCFERMMMEERLDSRSLQQFHQDFLQMMYSSLKQKKIQAHLLLNDAVSISLFDRSTKSISDMQNWIKHVIARIQEGSLNNEDSLTIVEKVKRYVALHITDNPSREDLANYVFLNPDYLSRLFKKETGMTLISYCQNVRLQYIKDLLAKTDINIGKIATQLGYSNFSHFTRAFKELTGVSPTEYRLLSKSGNQ